jgi:hypothetical protein
MSQFGASHYFMRIPSSHVAATNKALSIGHGVLSDAAASKFLCLHDDKIITVTITIAITITVPLLVKVHLPHWYG